MFPVCLNQINSTITSISHMKDKSSKITTIIIDKAEDINEATDEYLDHQAIINQEMHTKVQRKKSSTTRIPKNVATPFPPLKERNTEKR